MDVEFKIIGDLTMRQFMYLALSGGIAYGVFAFVNSIFKWPIILFLVLFGLSLAFLPIEDRGLDQWVVNFIKSIYLPNQRIWKKTPEIPAAFTFENLNVVRQELITLSPTTSRRKLEEFLTAQDSAPNNDPLDFQEHVYINKVAAAFAGTPVSKANPYTPGGNVQKRMGPGIQTAATAPIAPAAHAKVIDDAGFQKSHSPSEEKRLDSNQYSAAVPGNIAGAPGAGSLSFGSAPKTIEGSGGQAPAGAGASQTTQAATAEPKHLIPEAQFDNAYNPSEKPQFLTTSYFEPAPITPDRHSGRAFTNLVPSKGEIVLPIKGEKTLRTSEEMEIDEELQNKTKQLNALLEQIKRDAKYKNIVAAKPVEKEIPLTSNVQGSLQMNHSALEEKSSFPSNHEANNASTINTTSTNTGYSAQFGPDDEIITTTQSPFGMPVDNTQPVIQIGQDIKNLLAKLQRENKELSIQIERLKQDIANSKGDNDKAEKITTIQKLEKEKEATEKNYSQIKEKYTELTEKSFVKKAIEEDRERTEKVIHGETPEFIESGISNTIPNIISGKVVDQNNRALENIVLIIKNHAQEPVRALKTNPLGEFAITTPLLNGTYTIETDKSKRTNLSFDIIKVEVAGKIIPPILIKGR